MPSLEKWKTIATHTGYEVSNRGRIRNKKTGHILKSSNTRGYLKVNLSQNNELSTHRMHRLVAFAFLGEPPTDKHVVHHVNHNKADNNVENLEWVTPKRNSSAQIEWHGKRHRVHLENDLSAVELLGKIAEIVQRIEKECLG